MKKIMFCGGGSAGHVMPNIALCEILDKKYDLTYIGTDAIEKKICTDNAIKFYQFDGVKLVRGKILCNLAIPFKLAKSIKQCKKILQNVKPDLLFCKGGYASLPPAFAAHKLGIPVITHESDITAGLANKLIAGKSSLVLTSFPSTAEQFKNGVYCGSPMRRSLFGVDKKWAKARLKLDNRPTVLVFGGGSGSKAINQNLRSNLFELCKNYNVIHLCGRGNLIESNVYGYKQIEFSNDMGTIYACADYAVARSGSNSAHELIALKIPTLFIPLDNGSSRGDQVKNAEYFSKLGLCSVLSERDLNQQTFKDALINLINDNKIKTALQRSNVGCGNDKIIEIIEDNLSR
ncbi:MAG: UDP-N-acetylglucosamine--N-acetylmuramyl-(pentapeptide) pyrophosphoryl-undecaprenol N-acetylglucosamine transferase [Clostridia bacterium]|nr:UDP-N-acetylglucosamine--N-acetylmuramyl-(pentapeptide) pyrophosphoryl-undecaprenol N-acetylglucosamine transferase [Clostridia bacterium]